MRVLTTRALHTLHSQRLGDRISSLPARQMGKKPCAILLGILLCLVASDAQKPRAVNQRTALRTWLQQGKAKTVSEQYVLQGSLLSDSPACIVSYINIPAWATAKLSVKVIPVPRLNEQGQLVPPSAQARQCLPKALTWRASISTYDPTPKELDASVGYRGTMQTKWNATVLLSSDIYNAPPPPAVVNPDEADYQYEDEVDPYYAYDYQAENSTVEDDYSFGSYIYDALSEELSASEEESPVSGEAPAEESPAGEESAAEETEPPAAAPPPANSPPSRSSRTPPARRLRRRLMQHRRRMQQSAAAPPQQRPQGPKTFFQKISSMWDCVILAYSYDTPANATVQEQAQQELAAMTNMTRCIRSIANKKRTPPPPSPPGEAGTKAPKFLQTVRNIVGFAPFKTRPVSLGRNNPYKGWIRGAKTVVKSTRNDGMYQIPDSTCKAAFSDKTFQGTTMVPDASGVIVSKANTTLDSCYLAQVRLYTWFDPEKFCRGSNFTADVVVVVTAEYTDYDKCNDSWRIGMQKAMSIALIVMFVPIAVLILFLGLPTIWRICYWPFRLLWIKLYGKKNWDVTIKHQFRMKTGTDSWDWVQALYKAPVIGAILRFRKHLVTACTSVSLADGHSRLLQIFIIATCTVSVTVMVWRPTTEITLNISPDKITFQLQDVEGPSTARTLGRYFQIFAISILLGVLAFLSSLANINKVGNPYWNTQRVMSGLCLLYLSVLIMLQFINVGAYFLSMADDLAPYAWVLAIQGINVFGALIMQIFVLFRHEKLTQLSKRHLPPMVKSPVFSSSGKKALDSPTPSAGEVAVTVNKTDTDKKGTGSKDLAKSADAKDGTSSDTDKDSDKDMDEEKGPSGLQKLKKAFSDWILEETDCYLDNRTGNVITVKTFRYPSWFLASVLVAFYMLIFHFIKAVIWARDLGDCIQDPETCKIGPIATWSSSFSVSQLAPLRGLATMFKETLTDLRNQDAASADLTSAVMEVVTTRSLAQWIDLTNSIINLFTLGNFRPARWAKQIGQRWVSMSIVGFSIGCFCGLFTLTWAMASWKAVIKKNRIIKFLQRLEKAREASGGDSNPFAAVGGVVAALNKATQASGIVSGTAHVHVVAGDEDSAAAAGGDAKRHVSSASRRKTSTQSDDKALADVSKDGKGDKDKKKEKKKKKKEEEKPEGEDAFDITGIAAVRATDAPLATVVFFIGVLLSATVLQLYILGVALTSVLAVITTKWFWTVIMAKYYPFILVALLLILFNKFIVMMWLGNTYTSDGNQIIRPAGWFAFMIITMITNLVLGLFLALTRLILLLVTTVFTIGMLDRSILSVRSQMDVPYNAFLAGIHLQNCLTNLGDPALRPGVHGRAVRRWRAAKDAIVELGAEQWDELVQRNIDKGLVKPDDQASSTVKLMVDADSRV